MELFEDIRAGHRAGASIRELSDKHRVHRRTVRQAIAEAVPPARKRPDRGFPVAGRWEPVVRGWLVADQVVHRKQRHTAQRVWERLVEEHDAVISASTVRAMVVRLKRELAIDAVDVTVPQTHPPGAEAEVDFGEFRVVLGGVLVTMHMFIMRLSHSAKAVHYAYLSESTEAFLDGHVRAFTALGGVPGRIRYDNLTAAVLKVLLGRDRLLNPRFIALRSHYGFESFFCEPGQDGAHEKGGVEGEVGRFRRQRLTPVPVTPTLAALDALMAAADARDDHRRVDGRRATVGQWFAQEAPSLAPLPVTVFDPATVTSARVDTKARICVRGSHYSVPSGLAGRRVDVAIGGMGITVRSQGQVVATHPRAVFKGEQVLNLDHYLEVLIRKPGAMAGATALARAKAGGGFTGIHQQFWDAARRAHGDGPGTRNLIGVLQLHRTMGTAEIVAGMQAALLAGTTNPDVVAAEARRHLDTRRAVPTLEPPENTAAMAVPAIAWNRAKPSLEAYDTLITERSAP